MSNADGPVAGRESIRPYILAWLAACLVLTAANLSAIPAREFPDPDDTLRLLQVRDWLAGQSWFDLHQYRMNPPEGAPMHWSRLVDLPIAAVMLLLRPLVGSAAAETGAMVMVPLLTLAAVIALTVLVARRLLERQDCVLAAFLVPIPGAVAFQLRPMRIDHHGWQMALAMAMLLAAIDTNRRRSGVVAGALAATWLSISMEGVPFAVALVALAAIRWLVDPRESERLVATTASLAATSLVLFALTKDLAGWTRIFCDAISPAHLAVFALGAAGTGALAAVRPARLASKLAGLAAIGAASLALMVALAPQCAAGPFEALDPLVYRFWYLNVPEGLPLWRQKPETAALAIVFPLIGIAGSWLRLRHAEGEARAAWAVTLFFLLAAVATTLFVQRATSVAHLFAMPGAIVLFRTALPRALSLRSVPMRAAAGLACLAILAPGLAIHFAGRLIGGSPATASAKAPERCLKENEILALNRLPAGDIASPLDIGPSIIVMTHHRIIASGHHRNAEAMRDVISLFLARPDDARAIIDRRRIDYVVVCPGLPETHFYRDYSPRGLSAQLVDRRIPDWLEPVPLAGVRNLRIWRVKRAS